MNISEYIENRLQAQQDWYMKKANLNKSRFMNFQTVIIILGAIIPLIVVFKDVGAKLFSVGWSGPASAVIAALIAILAGMDKLTQPQANWFNYRSNEEMLKKEEWMYYFRTGPYNDLDDKRAEKILVDRVESIISADIARFAQAEYKQEEPVTPPADNENNAGGEDTGVRSL